MEDYRCLTSEIGLRPSKLPRNKIDRPRQYSFDFSGDRKVILEPAVREYDFSDEIIFFSKDGRFSFDFEKLEKLLSQIDNPLPYDEVIIQGSISRLEEVDEVSESSTIQGGIYFFRIGDIDRIKQECRQKPKTYLNHSVLAIVPPGRNHGSYVMDIGG